MKIYSSIDQIKVKKAVISVGTFDGLHKGHMHIFKRMQQIAKEIGGETLVFTFEVPPRIILFPKDKSTQLLSSKAEKIDLFEHVGIDHLLFFSFTKEFASLPFLNFVQDYLVASLNVAHLVLGFDHHFGKGREGNFESLKVAANSLNIGLSKVEALKFNDYKIGSSEIRKVIAEGDIEKANLCLSYPYSLIGKVVKGNQIGRTIGFPTANIETSKLKLIPKVGVYAVWVYYKNDVFKGMLNIGFKPTIDNKTLVPTVEVHILEFNQDIYDQDIKVSFVKRIREEKKFDSLNLLLEQLVKDKVEIVNLLK